MKTSLALLALVALWPAAPALAQTPSAPPLINYQGRLTDDQGQPLASGGYRLAFRLWADATSTDKAPANLVWGREFEITLVNGAFHVILGDAGQEAEAGLDERKLVTAFAAPNRFLGLTVLRTPAGPVPVAQRKELLPRQQLLSTPFSLEAARAAKAEAITTNATVQTVNLADGAVTLPKLATRPMGTNVPAGGIAVSLPVVQQRLTGAAYEKIQNLKVTIETTGRPVMIFLVPPGLTNFPATPAETPRSGFSTTVDPGTDLGRFRLLRDGGQAAISTSFGSTAGGSSSVGYSTVMGPLIDFPGPGTHSYELEWGFQSSGGLRADIFNQVLVAFEL
jgi:hypothetical protein